MDQGDHNAHRTSRCARNGASGRPRPTGSSSSTPVCAPGHLPPGRGKAGRAARCAAPTACTEAVPPFFVGAGHWPAHRCTRRVQESAPLQGAETPTGDRKGRPYGVSSTSTVGSVKPGAEFESHRMQFWGSQAPSARLGKKRSGAPSRRALQKCEKSKKTAKSPAQDYKIRRGIPMIRYDAGQYDIAVIGAGH